MIRKMLSISAAKDHLRQVFLHSVQAVLPQELVRRNLSRQGDIICVNGRTYSMANNVYVVGFGKAVLQMAAAAAPLLAGHLKRGVLSVPIGSDINLSKTLQELQIAVLEGAQDNMPDHQASRAAQEIQNLVLNLQTSDILLVLVSGGGSALLPMPRDNVSLAEKLGVIKLLSQSGASIGELNQVRITLSSLKGGQLAKLARGASVVSLILSDIIGDPLHLIASGPTVQPPPNSLRALKVIEKYGVVDKLSSQVLKCFETEDGTISRFDNVQNVLIGNNLTALQAAANKARELGHCPVIISDSVAGDVCAVEEFYVNLAKAGLDKDKIKLVLSQAKFPVLPQPNIDPSSQSIMFIAGGEPTVVVRGVGRGGRNQELALRVGRRLPPGRCFLSAGTDGLDGPTDAAGAVFDSESDSTGLEEFLQNSDSNTFLKNTSDGKNLIVTGHTGTNVMDIHLLLVQCTGA